MGRAENSIQRQADEGERKTPLFSLQDMSLSLSGGWRGSQGEMGTGNRSPGRRQAFKRKGPGGSLTPLLTHISEPQLPWWHKSAMTGGLWARDDACHHLGRPGTKEGSVEQGD